MIPLRGDWIDTLSHQRNPTHIMFVSFPLKTDFDNCSFSKLPNNFSSGGAFEDRRNMEWYGMNSEN